MIVYGNVRGGAGTAGTRLTYNGSNWLPAAVSPLGVPGVALSAWSEGQVIQVLTPSQKSIDSRQLRATDFGAKGDATTFAAGVTSGTPDEADLQALLDFFQSGNSYPVGRALLDATPYQFVPSVGPSTSGYRIRCPLVMNDHAVTTAAGVGNSCTVFEGEDSARSGLVAFEHLGPARIIGNAGDGCPSPVLDPSGSGEWVMNIGAGINPAISTTASGAQTLPASTINVASTLGFPPLGQLIVNLASGAQNVTYTGTTPTSFTGVTGGSGTLPNTNVVQVVSQPMWNLSDYHLGDLSTVSSFTWEYFVNPIAFRAWLASKFPAGNFNSSIFGSEGVIGGPAVNVVNHLTFRETWQTSGTGVLNLQFQLQTTGGSYTTHSSLTTDQAPPGSALSHVAHVYDNSAQKLYMFINGGQPSAGGSVMTVSGITGTLAQQWFESLSIASGANSSWPFQYTSILGCPAVLLGRVRFSVTARYTAPFTPPTPSQVTCDSNTRFYMDFDPVTVKTFQSGWQSPSIPVRPTLRAWNIAQCGNGRLTGSGLVNYPCWMYNRTASSAFTGNARVRNMWTGSWGEGDHLFASPNSEVGEGCQYVTVEAPITFDAFSYNSGVGTGVKFLECGGVANGGVGEIYFSTGSQFMYVKDGWSSAFSFAQFGIVDVFTDLKIGKGFPNGYRRGVFAFLQNVNSILLDGPTMIDVGGGGFTVCGILWVPTVATGSRLTYRGGYIGMQNSTVPVVLIGNYDSAIDLDLTVIAPNCPLFSFQGAAAVAQGNPVRPAIMHSIPRQILSYCDAANPGPVQVPELLASGVHTITMASANLSLNIANGDAQYAQYLVGGVTGATQTITWPSNKGAIYQGRNNLAGQSVVLASLSGVGTVTVAAGAAFGTRGVQDTGAGLVAL